MRSKVWITLALVSLCAGCSFYGTAAPTYAPLLDHAGQLDIAAHGGAHVPAGWTAGADIAYAPVDHLVITGGFDRAGSDTVTHTFGRAGVGTFVRDRVLRLEAIAGVNAGHATGVGIPFCYSSGPTGCGPPEMRFEGAYVSPWLQAFLGFEVPYFEFAGGLRVSYAWSDVRASNYTTTELVDYATYSLFQIEPVLTFRFPIDIFRFEISAGLPLGAGGMDIDYMGEQYGLAESPAQVWVTGGIAFQLDTVDPPLDDAP